MLEIPTVPTRSHDTFSTAFHLFLATWPSQGTKQCVGDHRQRVVQYTLIFKQWRGNGLWLVGVQKRTEEFSEALPSEKLICSNPSKSSKTTEI